MPYGADTPKTALDPDESEHSSRCKGGNTSPPALRWVPILSLSARHRPQIQAHLLALPGQDRYLRFGYAASNAQVAHYADLIDFSQDEVLGIFGRRLELLAMAHLAIRPTAAGAASAEAEFGVSVLPNAQGRGYGARLFDHAVLHARNRKIETLLIHALSENSAMLQIARGAGATIERVGGESQARLRLPPDDLMSHVDELVESHAAVLDFHFKAHSQHVDGLLEALDAIKRQRPCKRDAPSQ